MKKIKKVKFTIRMKLIVMASILLIVPLLSACFVSYEIAKSELDKKGEAILKNSVKQAILFIQSKETEVAAGSITLEDAQEQVREYLLGPKDAEGKRQINKNIDLGENGYFFVYDETGMEVAHPTMEGQNVWDAEDKSGNGFKMVQEQIKAAQNGGGFVTYTWTLPNSEDLGKKITYQELETNWGWVVAAGTYMKDFNDGANRIVIILLTIGIISILLGMVIILIFAGHLSRPIKKISSNLEEMAQGNLMVDVIHVKNQDETGILAASYNVMLSNMKQLISTMKETSSTVLTNSDSLAGITEETRRAINEVAITIQEVARAVSDEAMNTSSAVDKVNYLSESIETVAGEVVFMNKSADKTTTLSKTGITVVENLLESTSKDNEATQEIGRVIEKVRESSYKINVITETITQISQQTNLLALNASIEAARAGEAGKGFAVVADEIRKLAEESGKAVGEIKGIINEIQEYSDSSVETMALVEATAKEQNAAVENTKDAFTEINKALEEFNKHVEKINNESISMRKRKDEIVKIMGEISESTEQTSAASEEVSASSEEQLAQMEEVLNHAMELKNLSVQLTKDVDSFRI